MGREIVKLNKLGISDPEIMKSQFGRRRELENPGALPPVIFTFAPVQPEIS
jgi:hypothetical protein